MIEALMAASEKVTATIKEHRGQGDGFKQVCRSLGIDPKALTEFVDDQAAQLNGSGTVDGALLRGVLIGATAVADGGSAAPLATDGDLDWAAIGMLLPPHELRTRILRHLHKVGKGSPNEMAKVLDAPLGNVSYHVQALLGGRTEMEKPICDKPLLMLIDTQPRRGAVEHFYTLTDWARGKKATNAA